MKNGTVPPLRPAVPKSACSNDLYAVMERCWSEFPIDRPSFVKIKELMKKIVGKETNLVDHLLNRMEQYANNLERQVAEKTQQFMDEKHRSEDLLCQLLPKFVEMTF